MNALIKLSIIASFAICSMASLGAPRGGPHFNHHPPAKYKVAPPPPHPRYVPRSAPWYSWMVPALIGGAVVGSLTYNKPPVSNAEIDDTKIKLYCPHNRLMYPDTLTCRVPWKQIVIGEL